MKENNILFHRKFQCNTLENYKDFCPMQGGNIWKSMEKTENGKFYQDRTEIISDELVKVYYGDKTKGINITTCEIKVIEDINKISIRYSYVVRKRRVGRQYFSVLKTHRYVTYNYVTKNFYHGTIETTRKKVKRKKVRCNTFYIPFLTEVKLAIRRNVNHIISQNQNWQSLVSTAYSQMTKGDEIAMDALKQFAYSIYSKNNILLNYNSNYLEGEMYKMYLKDNNVSYPDSVNQYTVIPTPKSKLLKHGNVVHYFMNIADLKGRRVRQILNQTTHIDFKTLVDVYHNMGVDYFSKIRESFFKDENNFLYHRYYNHDAFEKKKIFPLTNLDKKRIVDLINNDSEIIWNMIMDHLITISKLKKFGEEVKMRFTNRDEFNEEHYRITELLENYRDGKVSRFNGHDFQKELSEMIMYDGFQFYPVLLTNSTQYNEESKVQSNCVRTYIEKPQNIIISLRRNTMFGSDRITVEYLITPMGFERVQNRKKYNQSTDEWDEDLMRILDYRLDRLYEKGIFQLTKIWKEFNNGKVIERSATFAENEDGVIKRMTPDWDGDYENIGENFDLPF